MTLGRVTSVDGRIVFSYQRALPHPPDAVWALVSEPDGIEKWAGYRPDLDLAPGGRYVSYHGGGERVEDEVWAVEPARLLVHTFWKQVQPSSVVRWELTPTPIGTRLALFHTFSEDDVCAALALSRVAGTDARATMLARNAAGWHRLLDRLEDVLNDTERPWSQHAQSTLQDQYRHQLPI